MTALTVRDLPLSERPRERLTRLGAEALSEQELLACVLGRGVAGESVLLSAQRLLSTFGTLKGIADASVEQLSTVHGIGAAKAVQLKASVEIARRLALSSNAERPLVEHERVAAALVRFHPHTKCLVWGVHAASGARLPASGRPQTDDRVPAHDEVIEHLDSQQGSGFH